MEKEGIWFWVEDVDTGQRLNINADDCDYITVTSNRYRTFIIGSKVYMEVRGIEELEADLLSRGFALTDRSHLVNMNRVKHWDRDKGRLFFEKPVKENSKWASVARVHLAWIESVFKIITSGGKMTLSERSRRKNKKDF